MQTTLHYNSVGSAKFSGRDMGCPGQAEEILHMQCNNFVETVLPQLVPNDVLPLLLLHILKPTQGIQNGIRTTCANETKTNMKEGMVGEAT